jgi:hypothetical protein
MYGFTDVVSVPSSPITPHSPTIPRLAKACWHFVLTITDVTKCSSKGRLLLLYIPSVMLLSLFCLSNDYSGHAVDQDQDSDWAMWENIGLRKYASDIVGMDSFFENRRNKWYLQENTSYGMTEKRFQCTVKFSKYGQVKLLSPNAFFRHISWGIVHQRILPAVKKW